MKVLNFGSLNIDFVYSLDHVVHKGETVSSEALNIYSGGKGLNQSIAMGRAGVEVYHAGAVGADGKFLTDMLDEAGVDTKYVKLLSEVRTGNAIIQKDKHGDNCIILYGGANQSISREQIDETLSAFAEGDYLVLQNEINEIKYLVEKASGKGMQIVLNPSPMNEKILELPLESVSWFVLNEIEAGQILGVNPDEKTGEDLARALKARFPKAKIALTLGSQGSVYFDGETLHKQSVYKVKVVDTTAAGDTFTGYLIAGLLKDMLVSDMMDLAARAAAITVSGTGAAPSIPTMEQVESWEN